jgi:hypothetical protein
MSSGRWRIAHTFNPIEADTDSNGDPEWRIRAACRSHDPEDWFPRPGQQARTYRALVVCASCPVTAQCAALALRTKAKDGIWAGVLLGRPRGKTQLRKLSEQETA